MVGRRGLSSAGQTGYIQGDVVASYAVPIDKSWKLVFDEEFGGRVLDPDKWQLVGDTTTVVVDDGLIKLTGSIKSNRGFIAPIFVETRVIAATRPIFKMVGVNDEIDILEGVQDWLGEHHYGALWVDRLVTFYHCGMQIGVRNDIASDRKFLVLGSKVDIEYVHVFSTSGIAVDPQERYGGPGAGG